MGFSYKVFFFAPIFKAVNKTVIETNYQKFVEYFWQSQNTLYRIDKCIRGHQSMMQVYLKRGILYECDKEKLHSPICYDCIDNRH